MSTHLRVRCGTCWFCNEPADLAVDSPEMAAAVLDWIANRHQRPHIQDAFPQLTAGEREMILNGSHEACFDAAFSDEGD